MNPDEIYSSYKRYKADTDAVASWLLTTAQKNGCHEYDTAQVRTPRLKGRARKLAREAKTAGGDGTGPKIPTYRLQVKDFVPLAKHIAGSSRRYCEGSESFSFVLQRAIRTRKAHTRWFDMSSQSGPASTGSNEGHKYFIRTLEVVQEILRPFLSRDVPGEATDTRTEREVNFTNMFETLTVEETLEAGGVEQSEASEKLGTVTEMQVTVEDTTIDDSREALIASFYVSYDVHRLRKTVQGI